MDVISIGEASIVKWPTVRASSFSCKECTDASRLVGERVIDTTPTTNRLAQRVLIQKWKNSSIDSGLEVGVDYIAELLGFLERNDPDNAMVLTFTSLRHRDRAN